MAKKVTKMVKLQVEAGKATPAPPVSGLGSGGGQHHGLRTGIHQRTAQQAGLIIPVEITVYDDRSFTFITKMPPAAVLLKKAAGWKKLPANRTRRKSAASRKRKSVKSRNEDARPERQRCGSGDADGRRYGAQHGYQWLRNNEWIKEELWGKMSKKYKTGLRTRRP